jgi:hypothetical protein
MIEAMILPADIAFEHPADSDEFRAIQRAAMTGETMTVRGSFRGIPVIWDVFVRDYGPHFVEGKVIVRGTFATTGPPRAVGEESGDGNLPR